MNKVEGLPLICGHQGYGVHQNIQYRQELQDLSMPNQGQRHHSQHTFRFHKLYAKRLWVLDQIVGGDADVKFLIGGQGLDMHMSIPQHLYDRNQNFQMNYYHSQIDDDYSP